MKGRAQRRHHYQRLKRKRVRENYWGIGTWRGREDEELLAAKAVDTPCTCSGDCCGNPRHSGWSRGAGKLTNQEKKSEEDFKSQLDEYYSYDDGYDHYSMMPYGNRYTNYHWEDDWEPEYDAETNTWNLFREAS